MRTYPRRFSLRLKWTLALVVTSGLPLLVFVYQAIDIQQHGLKATARAGAVATLDAATVQLDKILNLASETTHVAGRLLGTDIRPQETRELLVRELLARAETLAHLAVYNAAGERLVVIQRNDATTEPVLPHQLSPAEMNAEAGWLEPDVVGDVLQLAYLEAITTEDGRRTGWVRGTVESLAFDRVLGELAKNRYDDTPDTLLLIDRKLRVIAGKTSQAFTPGTSLVGKDVFAAVPLAASAPQASHQLDEAFEYRDAQGRAMFAHLRRLPQRGWTLLVRRPRDLALRELPATRRKLLLYLAGFIIAAAGAGILLGRRTTRPVAELADLARAYGRHDLTRRARIRSGDELEELGDAMNEMAQQILTAEQEIVRRATVEKDLSRYLPGEVAHAIAEGRMSLALGGERRQVTVLFADLVAFTPFAERAPPEVVVAFLNELFTTLSEVVFRHHGTIDKFLGDCIMALYGAPNEQPDQAMRALATAEDMHRFVEANAPAWKARYAIDVALAVGIAGGEVLVGNLGTQARMEYTAIGDVVNVAARLEMLARPGQTLVTKEVVQAAGDEFLFAGLGEHPLRGKAEPVTIFELR